MRIKTFFGKMTTLTVLLLTSLLMAEENPNVYNDIAFHFEDKNLITTFGGDDGDRTIYLNDVEIQEGPALFKLHANLSQAKMPVERGEINDLRIEIYDRQMNESDGVMESTSNGYLCGENLPDTIVEKGLLNIKFGGAMDCKGGKPFQDVIVETSELYLEIKFTVETPAGPKTESVKPRISFGTVPFAVKSNFAVHANDALVCEVAGHSAYTHRAAADENLYSPIGQRGYFEFATPLGEDGAWFQWFPADPAEHNTVRICRDPSNSIEGVTMLDKLTLDSSLTEMTGKVEINGRVDMNDMLFVDGKTYLSSDTYISKPGSDLAWLTIDGYIRAGKDLRADGYVSAKGLNIWNMIDAQIGKDVVIKTPLTVNYGATFGDDVGIGTSEPTAKLHVNGKIKAENPIKAGEIDYVVTQGYVDTLFNSITTDGTANHAASADKIGTDENYLIKGTGNALIKGNLTVGTTSLNATLDVKGSVNTDEVITKHLETNTATFTNMKPFSIQHGSNQWLGHSSDFSMCFLTTVEIGTSGGKCSVYLNNDPNMGDYYLDSWVLVRTNVTDNCLAVCF